MGPVDVSAPDGMLDSMEPPLKFEEDETWDNAPSQEDPFMSFSPTGTNLAAYSVDLFVGRILPVLTTFCPICADPAKLPFAPAGGAGMPKIDADDMQLPDLMVMLDSGIPN